MKFTGYIAAALLVSAGMPAMAQTAGEATPNVMVVSTPYHEYVFGIKDIDRIIFRYQDNVPDPENYEQYKYSILDGAYRCLNGWFDRDFGEAVVLQGDEVMGCCFAYGNYYDDGRYLNPSVHQLTLDHWGAHSGYSNAWNGLWYINRLIETYGSTPDDPEIAPLRVMRAYCHFWMMELYGDFAIYDHVLTEEEVCALPRRPRAEVAAFIESELLSTLSQDGALSKANDDTTYGRPNYWMAAALLAKLYLNWGVYTNDITKVDGSTPNPKLDDCVRWCDEIIQSGVFELGQGYRQKFFPDNGVHIKDFIYALDVDPDGKADGTATWYRWFGFKKDRECSPYPLGWEPTVSIAGNFALTKEAVARFNLPGDERNGIILQGPQYRFDANYNKTDDPVMLFQNPSNPTSRSMQLEYVADFDFDDGSIYAFGDTEQPSFTATNINNKTAWLNIRKGARCFKFPPREVDYTMWNRKQANDYPIFRFADILLTKAECILRGAQATNGDTPMSLFNQVRRCSSAPELTANPTMDELLDERSREFILEPWRRNDLIRFGKFEADWGEKNRYKVWDDADHTQFHWVEREGSADPNRRLIPLSRDILSTQHPTWQQNPGYAGL